MRDITLIFGCMFSGKTTRLIEFYNYSEVEPGEKIAVKPLIDTRYMADKINAHNGLQLPGHRVSKPEEIYTLIEPSHQEIYLDEIQFFKPNIYQVLLDLSLDGKKIIAAGLDLDFMGRNFGPMQELKKLATQHIELKAKCEICGKSANRTFRKAGASEQMLIGHADIYEARCEEHWNDGMKSRV